MHGLLIVVAWALQRRGSSSCGSRAVEHRLNSCGPLGSVTPWHVGSSQIGDQNPCLLR